MNSASPPLAVQAGTDIFARILDAQSGLVVLDCVDVAQAVAQFAALACRTGQAVYQWQPQVGLSSLRDAHGHFPDCQRFGGALRFMRQSRHFGVYLLTDLELPLTAADAFALRQLARESTGHVRRVVLLNPPATLAVHFAEVATQLRYDNALARRLRMRDGRWLVEG